ncbi:MAG: hypothetical protein QXX32_05215 [Thermofilum sp.]|uniref:hypothetical protein n=1 Tax=Thermofilum sp. TaxID=1961369 RepID=UPI00315EF0FA
MSVRVKKVETWKGRYRDSTRSRACAEYQSIERSLIELEELYIVLREMNEKYPEAGEILEPLREAVGATIYILIHQMDNHTRETYKELIKEGDNKRAPRIVRNNSTQDPLGLAIAVLMVALSLSNVGVEEHVRELIVLGIALGRVMLKKTYQEVLNKMSNDEAKKRGQLDQLKKNITELVNRIAELEKQREELLNRLQEVQEIVEELKEMREQLLKLRSQNTSRNTNYVRLETENTKMQLNCISHYSISMQGGYYSPMNTFEKVSRNSESLVPGGNLNNGNNSLNSLKQTVGSKVGVLPKGRLTVEVVREDNGERVQGVEVEINGKVSRTDQRGVVVKEVDYGSKVRVIVRDTRVGDVVYVVERWKVEGGRAVCEGNACTLEVSGNVELRAYVKIVRVAG